jgi:hypothetical protein
MRKRATSKSSRSIAYREERNLFVDLCLIRGGAAGAEKREEERAAAAAAAAAKKEAKDRAAAAAAAAKQVRESPRERHALHRLAPEASAFADTQIARSVPIRHVNITPVSAEEEA